MTKTKAGGKATKAKSLIIHAAALTVMREDCAQRMPEEACGALVGDMQGDAWCAERCVPLANRDAQPERHYAIAPADLFRLERDSRAAGLDILGFYHSHPDSIARPSREDLRLAWPGYVYLIVAADDVTGWRVTEDRSGFEPVVVSWPR